MGLAKRVKLWEDSEAEGGLALHASVQKRGSRAQRRPSDPEAPFALLRGSLSRSFRCRAHSCPPGGSKTGQDPVGRGRRGMNGGKRPLGLPRSSPASASAPPPFLSRPAGEAAARAERRPPPLAPGSPEKTRSAATPLGPPPTSGPPTQQASRRAAASIRGGGVARRESRESGGRGSRASGQPVWKRAGGSPASPGGSGHCCG